MSLVLPDLIFENEFFVYAANYSPGLIFGWAVLAPAIAGGPRRLARQSAIVLGSTAIYIIAVQFAIAARDQLTTPAACTIAGLLGGGLLLILLRTLAQYRPTIPSLLSVSAWCFAGGLAIGFGLEFREGEITSQALQVLGFILWQWGFAVSTVIAPAHEARRCRRSN